MMLIGQCDSPFVRRVAITLRLYGLAYDHAAWSTFGDAEKIAAYNPLIRVPTLVFDDGFVLMDSAAILETLDGMVGHDKAFLARAGAEKRMLLRLCGLAAGAADKGVALVYEGNLRPEQFDPWIARCRNQIAGALGEIEAERAARTTPWLFGATLSHADIILGTMVRFLTEAVPYDLGLDLYPALALHAAACEDHPEFQATYTPYSLAPPSD
ncbi:glutathione S-transferase family protein [Sphingomonas sp. MMS24-J13]|uniref:glutathione S-transferase family protein n=1 Tax=Sphingomonas sp. MMS24-J13 TaxID=3238686 RepID=UPI00384AA335